jgi:hypothetical protein
MQVGRVIKNFSASFFKCVRFRNFSSVSTWKPSLGAHNGRNGIVSILQLPMPEEKLIWMWRWRRGRKIFCILLTCMTAEEKGSYTVLEDAMHFLDMWAHGWDALEMIHWALVCVYLCFSSCSRMEIFRLLQSDVIFSCLSLTDLNFEILNSNPNKKVFQTHQWCCRIYDCNNICIMMATLWDLLLW